MKERLKAMLNDDELFYLIYMQEQEERELEEAIVEKNLDLVAEKATQSE